MLNLGKAISELRTTEASFIVSEFSYDVLPLAGCKTLYFKYRIPLSHWLLATHISL